MTTEFESQLAILKKLQEIDLQINKITRNLTELPSRISVIESEYLSAKEEYEAAKAAFDTNEDEKRKAEIALKSTAEELKQKESKLYAIKTNKEYQAVLKEIADAKRANKEREEQILVLMEQNEELSKKITQLNQVFTDKEAGYKKESGALEEERKEFGSQIKSFEGTRPETESQLDKAILRRYNHIRQRYPEALVEVKNGVCRGCSMNIPPQLYNEMLRFDDLKNCPSCRRLIFIDLNSTKEDPSKESKDED